jgi:hypothetical protein
MSEEQPRWVERNVDGLVQLHQSGECHIFRAFFSLPPTEKELHLNSSTVSSNLFFFFFSFLHLELDSKTTLSVLCDQIVPPDKPMEDEVKVTLVVAFLAEEARRPGTAAWSKNKR